ncbi:hypothetical protein ASG68_04380 [Rhizobium sp. Leaf453]|nr:hypothetical protein ASG50_08510 [Rhizobium sp. Leaf386]KQS90625.1 hypothetical protein ASG42_08780 [Rhizobium sp. Leaf391]KQU10214.1 hypothetical protein ASG68_04380 [Rhizobium sp. Leaf453]
MRAPSLRQPARPEVIPAIPAFNRPSDRKPRLLNHPVDFSGNREYEAAPIGNGMEPASSISLQILAGMTQISFACVKCLDDGSGWNRLATQITKREETP